MANGWRKNPMKDIKAEDFNIKTSGTCMLALSCAIDEARHYGIEYRTERYYDFIARRKIEIWRELENKTYKFIK